MSVPSVPGWMTDSAVHNSTFASPEAPSAANSIGMHSYDPSTAGVLPQQFQQTHHAQLQNGNSRTASPGFQPPAYNVIPVIPLKRPRPRDDSISISPRQTPVGLPPSRSQTPLGQNQQQLAYHIYQNNQNAHQNAQRQFTPVGYSHPHLQHVGSANATPSPVMKNQSYNPQVGVSLPPPKRVATQSPSPFSPIPTQQAFMPQGSPPSNHVSRVNTPQNNNLTVPPQTYNQGFTQGFSPPASTASASPIPISGQNMQNQAQAQIHYAQMQARQQQQQQQQHHQQRMIQQQQQQQQQLQSMVNQSAPPNSMPMTTSVNSNLMSPNAVNSIPISRPQSQGNTGHYAHGHMPPVQNHRPTDPRQFMKSLYEFMKQQGTPIEGYPYIGQKQVILVNLYACVLKIGGSLRVSMENKWQQVAMSLGFSPEQFPTAAEELAIIFKQNLASYEQAWVRNQRDMKQRMVRQNQQPGMQDHRHQQSQMHNSMQSSQSPQQPMHQSRPQAPVKPISTPNNHIRSSISNGYTPQPGQHGRQPTGYNQAPNTPSRIPMDLTPPPGQVPQQNYSLPPLSLPSKTGVSIQSESPHIQQNALPATSMNELPTDFEPKARVLDTHGGLNVAVLSQIGAELTYHKPTLPLFQELGIIDIHALTMMLKSGLPGEVRLALDTLVTVSVEQRWSLALESCEDLVETLVDAAETQLELLGEHVEETSEAIVFPAYEEVMRACRVEADKLSDVTKFGSLEHDLEKAADRLVCITTIFRNLSFFESNHKALADPNVIRFLSGVIERLGTSKLLLRTNINTLDFMKDIITYLSNLSHSIALPSEEEALNLLHLILAFAPQPLPAASGRENLMFTSYQPSIHRYLPPAVDTLAKLLARDEPNRAFYKTVFLSESTTSPPYDLLTRSFALAISPLPDNFKSILPQSVEARRPSLEQGMLAAEILAGLAPGPEQGVARSWLSSEDGFALSLLRLVCLLSPQTAPQHPRQPGKIPNPDDTHTFSRITNRGMGVLQKLAEKSEDPKGDSSRLPLAVLPKKESLLGALLTGQIDGTIIKQLCTYAGLND